LKENQALCFGVKTKRNTDHLIKFENMI